MLTIKLSQYIDIIGVSDDPLSWLSLELKFKIFKN